MNHVTHQLVFADVNTFSQKKIQFCLIKKQIYRFCFGIQFLILLIFFEFSKIVLINMVAVLMMPAKMATLGLRKIKATWNKDYDVIIHSKTLPTNFFQIFQFFYFHLTRKITFFEGWSWFKFNNLRLVLGMTLKFYTSLTKLLKLKVRKFWWLIPTLGKFAGENLIEVAENTNLATSRSH